MPHTITATDDQGSVVSHQVEVEPVSIGYSPTQERFVLLLREVVYEPATGETKPRNDRPTIGCLMSLEQSLCLRDKLDLSIQRAISETN